MHPLQIENVVKTFASRRALDGVSLELRDAEVLGLLGPNGAGKSTLVRTIMGRVRPDSGTVSIFGKPAPAGDTDARAEAGVVPQEIALYPNLTSRENLSVFGRYLGLGGAALTAAIDHSLEWAALTDRANEPVKTLSGGMKRRLNMAAGVLHRPRVLLLDEPTVGVDPQSRNAIFENLETLKKRGKTLIYTTHYMEEAERLCDRIVIIDHGKVVADDTVPGLHKLLPVTNVIAVELDHTDGFKPEQMLALPEVKSAALEQNTLRIGVHNLSRGAPGILRWLAENGHSYHHVSSEQPNLETIFLTLTGRSLRDS